MNAPQIILIALLSIDLLISLVRHGQRHPHYNFGITLVASFINLILLAWGGFFN